MNKEIERAFNRTTKIVIGKELLHLSDYGRWLTSNVKPPIKQPSALSKRLIFIQPFSFFNSVRKRAVKLDEAPEFGKKSLSKEEVKELTLENATEKLKDIGYFTTEVIRGNNLSVEESGTYADSSYCFNGTLFVNSKYCAYCLWPRESEYSFGSSFIFSSKFCLKCHHSINLTRCFEVSHSANCSDCYFCHNCDNLQDCMFCFNTKNKRYSIANVELERKEYLRIKKILLDFINKELDKKKSLELSIFNIGVTG
ncbi:MAG: hypothetical protein ABIG39_04155 [Candidatus Micrarchaeota archaeon]